MSTNTITNAQKPVLSQHDIGNVVKNEDTGQSSLIASRNFSPGEVVHDFSAATVQSYATYLTVQLDTDKHIILEPTFLQYINHSCVPNTFFDTGAMQLICIAPVSAGDEFTFFYPSAEWDMAQPFVCNCGHPECLQLINGAAHLSIKTLSKYRLTDFIKKQVKHNLAL